MLEKNSMHQVDTSFKFIEKILLVRTRIYP